MTSKWNAGNRRRGTLQADVGGAVRLLASVFLVGLLAANTAVAHGPGGKASAAFEAYEKGDFPAEFRGQKNPLRKTTGNTDRGAELYREHCVACHGGNARGGGELAKDMKVKPADLQQMLRHFPDKDDYYLWVISKGGEAFDTPMPGFGEALTRQEIWQIVTWMQAGFPGTAGESEKPMHGGGHMPGMKH